MPINISTSPAFFRWKPACWLRITGDNAANFLQGQFTNDLRVLPQAGAVYGLWLTLKGKVLADSFVLGSAAAHEFWIGSYFSPASVICERIERHVIADDVTVENVTEAWAGVSVLGEGVAGVLEGQSGASSLVFRGRRDRAPNVECVYAIASGEPDWVAAVTLSAQVIDGDEIARRRIAAGIPAIPADVGPTDLPNEAGLDADAISYTKGCYLGQEVMARIKSMGQVRRRLLRVRGTGGGVPPVPTRVFAGVRQVGELRSAAGDGAGGWLGFAMVSLMHVAAGTELSFAAGGPPAFRLMDSP